MKTNIIHNLLASLIAVAIGSLIASFTGANQSLVIGLTFTSVFAASFLMKNFTNVVSNVIYSPILFTGSAYEEIFNEILFMNGTIEKGLVRLLDNINTETVLTEANVLRATQSYVPSPTVANVAGSLTFADKILRPFQFMIYDEFTPNTIILSRMGAANGTFKAFPKVTDDYIRLVLENYGKAEAQLMESRFWNASTTATKATVSGLVAGAGQNAIGTEEKAYVAASPTDYIDGIVTKLINTFTVTKRRYKVVGTTITSANINAEYAKVYAAILPQLLQPNNMGLVKIYAPFSHVQLINTFNVNATYRDVFQVVNGEYFYNSVKIEFVPLYANIMVAGKSTDLIWGCDIADPNASVKVDFLSANSEDMFIKAPYTQESSYVQAQQFVLYVG